MSWQTYVDTNLVGTGKVQRAAIFGHDGSCWATSAGFNLSDAEAKDIISALKDGTVTGKHFAGTRYMMVRNADKTAYFKAKDKGGYTAVLTAQAMIVGGYDEKAGGAGECNMVVESLGDYLKSSGF